MIKTRSGFTLMELVLVLGIIAIVSAGVFVSTQGNANRALENASLALQADIRYVQRRSIAEGQRYRITFELENNRYTISLVGSNEIIRTVYLRDGVSLYSISGNLPPQFDFLPRGTPSRGVTVTLSNGVFLQDITVVPSGGRADIRNWRRI